jgi:ureidoacrylate peracid hydrolase
MARNDFNPDPRLGKDRAALLLFDTLQAYLHPSDPALRAELVQLGVPQNQRRLLDGARAAGMRIFFARADHSADQSDVVPRLSDTDMALRPWSDPAKPFHRSVSRGDPGHRIDDDLAVGDDEAIMIFKHRWSAFYQTSLELALRTRGLDTIILAGGATDVGVTSTAFAARDLDFAMVIVRDACHSPFGANHDFLMDRVFPRMARIKTTDETLALMN